MIPLVRRPQLMAPFTASDPAGGYYNDMTGVVGADPEAAAMRLGALVASRRLANPVSIAQHGLGAWQRRTEDPRWLHVISDVVDWIASERGDDGAIRYGFSMPHTYDLPTGWASAMAQGEAASLLVRAADTLGRPALLDVALAVIEPLIAPGSALIASTPHGPVLQEYPTSPPAHVLNGWIFALWGLYDVSLVTGDVRAGHAFEEGVETLAKRLHLYATPWNWSTYDLFPHRLTHVTSPFYHRLHVEQLRAIDLLSPHPTFASVAGSWEAGLRNPVGRSYAIARKVAFRVLEPRREVR